MEIEFLTTVMGNVIAWELQFGKREGQFVLASDGSVEYRHASDDRIWFVASDAGQFKESVLSWKHYEASVKGLPEEQCVEPVKRLRDSLSSMGVLRSRDTFWSVIMEQVEAGLL
jgi:hypothetical protein